MPLKQRLIKSLAARKPSEAYKELKLEISTFDLVNYREELLSMALDWFPSFLDSVYNPQESYVDAEYIQNFQSLLRDIFNTKTKDKKFWTDLIFNINKFIDQSKVKELVIVFLPKFLYLNFDF